MKNVDETNNETALVWFTTNLRTIDNESLSHALSKHPKVIGVYFFDPRHYQQNKFGFKKTGNYRAQFLIETVTTLEKRLASLNIPLLIQIEKPETVLSRIVEKHKISHIYHQKEWTQEEVLVQKNCKQSVASYIEWISEYDQFLYHPDDIPFEIKDIPKVFTAFRKKVEKYSSIKTLSEITTAPVENYFNPNNRIPTLSDLDLDPFEKDPRSAFTFLGGEEEALNRLNHYFWETKNLSQYKETRNGLIGESYSSKFSPWLANGSLSAKTIYYQVKAYEKEQGSNSSTYWLIFELIWRDYFKYVSLKHQNDLFKIEGILHKSYEWSTSTKDIQNWVDGNTKEPFVNANMLELKHTGWMSNRGRQNVASYFAKTLQLDWRIGAAYFESLLLDYDVHSNYGNWQYVAGVGNDPRDRVFNVSLQAERYDPQNEYQDLWLVNETQI